MALVDSAINVLMTTDTNAFTSGMETTAQQLKKMLKAGQAVWESTRTNAEKYEQGLTRLNELLSVNAIDQETFNRAVKELPVPENVAAEMERIAKAQEEMTKAMEEGEKIAQNVRTADEKRALALKNLNELLKKGAINQETYNRAVEKAPKSSAQLAEEKQAKKAEQAREKAIARGKEVTKSLLTEEQKRRVNLKELRTLLAQGVISQRTYSQGVRANSKAYKEYQDAIQRGKKIFDQTRTASERRKQSHAELNGLLKAGAINQDTFNRALKALPQSGKAQAWAIAVRTFSIAAKLAVTAAAATLGAIIALGVKGASSLASLGKQAREVGTGAQALASLQYAARQLGGDSQAVTSSLTGLRDSIQQVASGASGPAMSALQTLGLSAQELNQMDPAQAFRKIAEETAKLGTQKDRMNIAKALGIDPSLIGLLSAGSDKLKEMQSEFQQLGGNLTDADVSNVNKLYAAFDKVSTAVSGLGMKIASAVSPLITGLTERFVKWATTGTTATDLVNGALERVRGAIRYVGDYLEMFSLAWKGLKIMSGTAVRLVIQGLGGVAKGIDWILEKLGYGASGAAEFFGAMDDEMKASIAKTDAELQKQFVSQSWGQQAVSALDSVANSASQAEDALQKVNQPNAGGNSFNPMIEQIDTLNRELGIQVATFNMLGKNAELYKLKFNGATDEQIKKTKELIKTQNSMDLLKSSATPLERVKMEIEQIEEAFRQGTLTKEARDRGIVNKYNEFQGDALSKHPGANLTFGSKEAYSAILNFGSRASTDPTKDTAKKAGGILNVLRAKHTPLLEEIRDNIKAAQVVTI